MGLFAQSKRTNKMLVEVILGVIIVQYIGLLALLNFDLSQITVGPVSFAFLLTVMGGAWSLGAVAGNHL